MERRWRLAATIFVVLFMVAMAGAGLWWLLNPVPGPLRLTRADFDELPGWNGADLRPALAAFARSCRALAGRDGAAAMGGAGYAGTAGDWRAPCEAATSVAAGEARAFFERRFTPYVVSAGRVAAGRFTGYYEPEILGSRRRHGAFRVPVYGRPDDLVTVDLGQFRPSLRGEHLAGRVEAGRLLPYATRADIDARGLAKAPILFYADDPVGLFFLHVQGSGRVRFEDGSTARVGYAAQNGQPYTAIGKVLIERGVPREDLSMPSVRAWLKAHPEEAPAVMERDASYIFFKEEPIGDPALGAKGTEGVPLTPLGSLAVDPRLHALGVPFFVSVPGELNGLFVAQDTGGAIRGPVRGDIFFGFGNDAETRAGNLNRPGRLYVLLPKPVAERLGARRDFPDDPP